MLWFVDIIRVIFLSNQPSEMSIPITYCIFCKNWLKVTLFWSIESSMTDFFHPFVHSLLPSSNNKTYFKTHAHCTWTIFSNDFVNSAKILRNEQMKTCFYQKCSMDWNYCRFWKTDWSGQSISRPYLRIIEQISMTKGSPYILLQFLWSYSLKWFLQKCLLNELRQFNLKYCWSPEDT